MPHRSASLLTALTLLAVCAGPRALGDGPSDDEDRRQLQRLRQGLLPGPDYSSPDQLRRLLGAPRRVSRQLFYQCRLEQWLYERPFPLRLEFDCRAGEPLRLVGVALPPAH